jgi:hypothetical protein
MKPLMVMAMATAIRSGNMENCKKKFEIII